MIKDRLQIGSSSKQVCADLLTNSRGLLPRGLTERRRRLLKQYKKVRPSQKDHRGLHFPLGNRLGPSASSLSSISVLKLSRIGASLVRVAGDPERVEGIPVHSLSLMWYEEPLPGTASQLETGHVLED